MKSLTQAETAVIVEQRLRDRFPGSNRELCALEHHGPFQLLVATILSAQCTDERVNKVTPGIFTRYPTPVALAEAATAELEGLIRSTGFFRSKARSLKGMAQDLVERFGGEVPRSIEDLVTLPGVGRKTANVVRSVEFDLPGLPVDTHVSRISKRLGLTRQSDPDRIEAELNGFVEPSERGVFSMRLILHGRAICSARSPRCGICLLADVCPSANLEESGKITRSRVVPVSVSHWEWRECRTGLSQRTAVGTKKLRSMLE